MVADADSSDHALPRGARDLDTKLAAALERAGQALRTELRERARRHGLPPTQAQVLLRLAHDPAERRRVAALAAELDVTQATLSDAVAALHRKRLVERRRDPADGRSRTLELTGRGSAIAGDLDSWDERVRARLAAFPEGDREGALRFLLELIADLQAAGVISVARTCVSCRFFRQRVHAGGAALHHCALLDLPLARSDLRVDCPEHQPAAA
ncbi:MAG TPA: MarR family winged helix-turn-helix transcriptional regulator [Thermoleophilaceae bacterium]